MRGTDVDMYSAQQMMGTGAEFWKYHYRQVGRPSRVLVQLLGNNPSDMVIAWRDHGEREFAASVAITDIMEVRKGPDSRTFVENQASIMNPAMCFSIYTRGRTLDLEAVHPEDLKVWVSGLKQLLPHAHKDREGDDVNYTYINSRTKEEWRYDGGRMVQFHRKADWRGKGEVNGDLLEEIERHLDMSQHQDPLDSIDEWLAMKRKTSKALGPPPEPLDVDQWFKAGPYRTDPSSAPGAQPAPAPLQIAAAPSMVPAATATEFDMGYRAGMRAVSRQAPTQVGGYGGRQDETVFGAQGYPAPGYPAPGYPAR